jgi:1-acyl-sn-glycerol-3-phosphate acyltransferase
VKRPDTSWARGSAARAVREGLLFGVLSPIMDAYTRCSVSGHEHLEAVEPPVLFVANHSSHMDTPLILRALPRPWRDRTAVAAAADYFYSRPWLAHAVGLVFNTVPVERKGAADDAAAELVQLIRQRWSVVVFAEGTRSRDGTIGRLHSGAALLAKEHELPMVPVLVTGTHAVMPPGKRWMRRTSPRSEIAVRFGPPVHVEPGEHRTETMERIRLFFEASGAATTPDKRVEARRTA